MSHQEFITSLYELTPEQIYLCENMLRTLKGQINPILFEAPAGVGKTYTMSRLIRFIVEHSDKQIVVSASTHKALAVLREKIVLQEPFINQVQFCTVHKVLKMKHSYNLEGEDLFYKTEDEMSGVFDLWIIDEASMISDKLCRHIKKYIEQHSIKLILLGDRLQLPPVHATFSPAFNSGSFTLSLNSNVRAKSSGILSVYNIFREYANTEVLDKYVIADSMTGIECVEVINKRDYKETLTGLDDIENWTILCYTNKKADYYNNMIRRTVLGYHPNTLEIGDILISKRHFKMGDKKCPSSHRMIVNNTNIISTEVFGKTFEHHSLEVSCITDPERKLPLLNLVLEENRNYFEDTILNEKYKLIEMLEIQEYTQRDIDIIWDEYYEQVYSVDSPITYGYAITIHKSQGSTYDKVIIDVDDIIEKSKDDSLIASKLLYTAVTRASTKVLFLSNYDNTRLTC